MNNIIIPNKEKLEQIKKEIWKQGSKRLHILTDFDRTLTYAQSSKGENIPAIISILRNGNYLTEGYAEKAHALFNKYHPTEISTSIPIEKKKKAMNEWWTSHFKLLIESGLNKKDLKAIVNSGIVKLRDGTKELFNYLHRKQIPIAIISSSGVGNVISMFLKKEGILCDNVHVIANLYNFNKYGQATSISEPIINVMNKDETAIRDHPEVYSKIKDRKNVILLGDSLGDLGMITGFNYNNLLKIGFLNAGEEQNKKEYEQNFDIIIINDSDVQPIDKLLKEILNDTQT